MSSLATALTTTLLALMLVEVTAPPQSSDYVLQRYPRDNFSFQKRVENGDQCYEDINIIVGGTVISTTRKCCEGYVRKTNMGCVLNKTSPCGNLTCVAVPDAHCELFKKCGKEVALFVHQGSIATECHDDSRVAQLVSCSGGCIVNPCTNTTCPAFKPNEVTCFPSGCSCQATWIRLQDKAQVNCLSGETISEDEAYRERRHTCNN